MKYINYDITLSEIPSEISLTILISGCPNGCPDCHSKFSWDANDGNELNSDIFMNILNKYKNTITCICFLGGEWDEEIIEFINISKSNLLNVALYSGLDSIELIDDRIIKKIDYIKLGHYDKKLGSIDSKNTNQKIYQIRNGNFIDITKKMR